MIDESRELYDLLVLEVGLAMRGSDALVRWSLRNSATGALLLPESSIPPAAMGIPDKIDRRQALYQGYAFNVPESLLGPLEGRLAAELPGRPLWLHLVKPYGYLGMVPWERLLQPRLGRPILRLPEHQARPPRETSTALDVILCGSGPVAEESFGIVQHLLRMSDLILAATVPRRTTLHVFTDREIHPQLRQAWESQGRLGDPIRLHPPESAEPYAIPEAASRVTDPGGRLESPWLLWMRDSLQGRSVDVVHFVCHGFLSRDRGALQFAESPLVNQDRAMSRLVGDAELTAFLTQIGAWSVAFSSPEQNYSAMGLRQLADTLAQSRPGPVLHHETLLDPYSQALAGAYSFLYSHRRQPPPASPALSLYCQPFYAAPPQPLTRGLPTKAAFEAPMTEAVFAEEENVPSWVAATERYVEQYEFRRREKTAPAPAGPRTRGFGAAKEAVAPPDPVQDTLRQIQEIVARAAANRTPRGEE